MKKTLLLASLFTMSIFLSCNSDDSSTDTLSQNIGLSFKSPSLTALQTETPIELVFSSPTASAGSIVLQYTEQNVMHGTDYILTPSPVSNTIEIPYQSGVTEVSFTFKKRIDALENEQKSVTFTIQSVSDQSIVAKGNTTTIVSFNPIASLGGTIAAEVGGSTQPNQVFFDFSSNHQQAVPRDSWDLGFYSGNEYRVIINGSIKMAVKKLETNDITQVVSSDPSVAVGTFVAENMEYVDHPYGNISGTAIAEISANASENMVYLLNLGNEVPTTPAAAGSVNTSGEARGWMKIKIDRSSDGYKLLYAPLDATTYSEVTIPKSSSHNFSFFSLLNQQVVAVEPEKEAWDIKFSTFTNEISGYGSYFYSDFVLTNAVSGVRAYKVDENSSTTYNSFTTSDIDHSLFNTEMAKDQRVIGSNWRSTQPLELYNNVFFVLKDAAGNIYKFKFTQLQDTSTNERGFPKFEYVKL